MNANVWAMTGMRADGDRWRLARKDGGGGGGGARRAAAVAASAVGQKHCSH